jgi:cyclophilin family peptidyl-prolyl cis-trans isomerase
MKKSFLLIAIVLVLASCAKKYPKNTVMISTEYGDIIVRLYDETPKHRDNFIKLAKEKFYDGTLFHRVIKEFMIQGGDPDSKNAKPEVMLGNGGPGYDLPAEIIDTLIHKKGVIAAAREGDDVNPAKKSSGSQFYIVQGKVFTPEELEQMEQELNMRRKQKIFEKLLQLPENVSIKTTFIELQQKKDTIAFKKLLTDFTPKVEAEYAKTPPLKFTEKQRFYYTTQGGTPFLDGNYTIFGEVIDGLDVLDKIAAVQTGMNDRPTKDVKMTVKVLN